MRPTFLLALFVFALHAPAYAEPTHYAEDPDVSVLDDFDVSSNDVQTDDSGAPFGLACASHDFEIDQPSLLDMLTHADLREPVTGYVYASDFDGFSDLGAPTYDHASGYLDDTDDALKPRERGQGQEDATPA